MKPIIRRLIRRAAAAALLGLAACPIFVGVALPRPAFIAAAPQVVSPAAAPAQTALFGLPFADPPGPSTWLLIQGYGNTATAYRWRVSQYGAGQGLHFGLDFSARCGTPVVAIGDGTVRKVDAAEHGAGPHNLMIDHGNGFASFYGHLFEEPRLGVGEPVTRGQVIAITGDPDLTCTSRPHLHLEIRESPGLWRAFNPVPLIAADWDALSLTGGRSFARDLNNPRQWQFLDDQPEVLFGGPLLNQYDDPWPLDWNGN